jgi:tetratricopeptide (TPR) repeat protein
MQDNEMTEEISKSTVQEAIYQSFDDAPRGQGERRPRSESYTYDKDPILKRRANDAARWLWILSGGLIFVTAAYVIFSQLIAKPMMNKAKAEQKIILGNEAIEDGKYQLALKHLESAYELNPEDTSIWLHLAVLRIQVVNQNVEGKRILEKLVKLESKDQKRVFTALGLSYLKLADYVEAESYFQKALDIDSSFTPAQINLGAASLYQGKHSRAASQFQLALKDGSADGAEVLMLVEALLNRYESAKEVVYLEEAKRYIDQYLSVGTDYKSEVGIALLRILSLMNKADEAYSTINSFLDTDPLQTLSHKHNIYVHRDKLTWKTFSQWCIKSMEKLDSNSRVIAAEAMCLYKAGELLDASRKIENAIAQTPRDSLVQAVYGYLLDEMGNFEKSKVAIDKSLGYDPDKKYELPRILQARFCVKVEDIICSTNFWNELNRMSPKSLPGIYGVSRSYFLGQQMPQARKFLTRGLDIAPGYIPFLELQRQMTQAQNRVK